MQEKSRRKMFCNIIMILCFVYAGMSAVLLISQIYYLTQERVMQFNPRFNQSFEPFDRNAEPNTTLNVLRGPLRRSRFSLIDMVSSSSGIIISLLAGFTLMDLLKKKETKEIKKTIIDTMLTPEEKTIINALKENNGELTQSELVRMSKLSKVKVHRMIKRLESLNVVNKYPYGITNKIKLEKEIYQE